MDSSMEQSVLVTQSSSAEDGGTYEETDNKVQAVVQKENDTQGDLHETAASNCTNIAPFGAGADTVQNVDHDGNSVSEVASNSVTDVKQKNSKSESNFDSGFDNDNSVMQTSLTRASVEPADSAEALHHKTIMKSTSTKIPTVSVNKSRKRSSRRLKELEEKRFSCNLMLSRDNSLKIRIHTGQKPYSCSACGAAFTQKSHLEVHMKTHSGEKRHACTKCDESFVQFLDLKQHLRNHQMRRYPCTQCRAAFRSPSHLKMHLRRHTGEKPYACTHCDASFKHPGHLKVHSEKHFEPKGYPCPKCDKSFAQKSILQLHWKKAHSGIRPYVCTECNAGFVQESYLRSHMRIHTGEKPYSCSECPKKFRVPRYLTLHMKRKHPEKQPVGLEKPDWEPPVAFGSSGAESTEEESAEKRKSVTPVALFRVTQRKRVKLWHQKPSSTLTSSDPSVSTELDSSMDSGCQAGSSGSSTDVCGTSEETDNKDFSVFIKKEDTTQDHLYDTAAGDAKDSVSLHGTASSVNCDLKSVKEVASTSTGEIQQEDSDVDASFDNNDNAVRVTSDSIADVKREDDGSSSDTIQGEDCDVESARKAESISICGIKQEKSDSDMDAVGDSHALQTDSVTKDGASPSDSAAAALSYKTCKKPKPNTSSTASADKRPFSRSKLSQEKRFSCSECVRSFAREDSLKIHMQLHTEHKSYSCPECGALFAHKNPFEAHMSTHAEKKPYACTKCDASFLLSLDLKQHLKTHNDRRYPCTECDAAFKSPSHLKVHMRHHTGEKPFECEECGTRFKQKSQMTVHLKKHFEPMGHPCPECDKIFAQKSILQFHLKQAHSAVMPYVCSECGAGFAQASYLRSHMRKHTGERPYLCSECPKQFRVAHYLTLHMRRVHSK